MNPSASAKFPFREDFENNCLRRAHTTEETIISAIRLYIVTRRGSRVGNMVGSFVPELLYELVSTSSLPNYASQLKSDLTAQFQGVNFLDVTFTRDLSKQIVDLIIKITFSIITTDEILDLEIKLPSIFSPDIINTIDKNDI